MRCPYCESVNEPLFKQCIDCGLWFSLKEQMRSWQSIIDKVVSCLYDEHEDCAYRLKTIGRELETVSK